MSDICVLCRTELLRAWRVYFTLSRAIFYERYEQSPAAPRLTSYLAGLLSKSDARPRNTHSHAYCRQHGCKPALVGMQTPFPQEGKVKGGQFESETDHWGDELTCSSGLTWLHGAPDRSGFLESVQKIDLCNINK
jgi:hypothetical protein